MFETAGTLRIVEATSSLLWLVLLPLVYAFLSALTLVRRRGEGFVVRLAIACSGGMFVLALVHAAAALRSQPGHIGYQHVMTLVRIGHLDVALDLVRDRTSASAAVLTAFIGFAAVLHAVWTSSTVLGRLAWTGLATSAVMLVVLADGLPFVAIGMQIGAIAGWALGRSKQWTSSGLVMALAGDVAFVGASLLLFWSMHGRFGSAGLVADELPRFAVVDVTQSSRYDGKAAVAITTYEGAMVRSDDGPALQGEPIRSPFVRMFDPGIYSFRIEMGPGVADAIVPHVSLAPGRSYVLTPFGSTTSLRNMGDQLTVRRPSPEGPLTMAAVLESRLIFGIPVTNFVGFLVVLAAILRLGSLARMDHGGLAFALEALPPVLLTVRVVPLLELQPATILAGVSAASAVVLASEAATLRNVARGPATLLASLGALAMTASLVGETAASLVILFAASVGAAALAAGLRFGTDARWLGVACASLAGVLPGAGISSGSWRLVAGALASPTAYVVALFGGVALVLVALATFKVYYACLSEWLISDRDPSTPGANFLVVVLAIASMVGGALLGVGSASFGGSALPLARRLVEARGGHDGDVRSAFVSLGLVLVASVFGTFLARRAMAMNARAPTWHSVIAWPSVVVRRAGGAIGATAAFFMRGVTVMNDDIVDDVTELLVVAFSWLLRGLLWVDRKIARSALARALGARTGEILAGEAEFDLHRVQLARTVLVMALAAALGFVVLSFLVVR